MHGRFSRFSVLLFPVCAAILLASCDTGSPTGPRIVSLTQVSGNEQAAPVGATVADPVVVRAVDQNGVPIPGVPLEWTVLSGGGSFVAASSATDQSGVGQAVFRLGNSTGTQRISATVGDQPPVIFSLTATAAPASQLKVSSGNNQTGTVGAALSAQLVASVTDAVNNPKAGVPVTFAVASGGGSISVGSVLTDAAGQARVTWILGTGAGAQAVVASSSGLPAVTFSATGLAAAPASMIIVAGNNQVGSPGMTLPTALRIRINDQYGNGVPGIPVTFTATAADGTVSPPSAVTGADGSAQGTWTLGPSGGLKQVSAAAGSLSAAFSAGSSVTYANISTGGRHTCAVSTDNVLYCWGYNGDGQLGVGESAQGSGPVYSVPQPSAVTGAQTFVAVSSGAYHTCGWTLSFNPYCWGKNVDGRVGNAGTEQINTPTHLAGSSVFRQMSAGGSHACGVTPADRLLCWGNGRDGQVGDGGTAPVVSTAVEVASAERFSTLSAGGLHSCGVTLAGNTLCWGSNLRGQLGDGGTSDRLAPTAIAGGAPFVRVAAGGEHTCALASTGAAWCWGDNTYGQLGDGSNASSLVPVLVAGGMIFESITAGMHHTCGIVGGTPPGAGNSAAGGDLYCWGRNSSGQLGNGSQISVNQPSAASGGLAFLAVSAGDFASCGVTTTNRAYCWGDNQYGQLGDGTTVRRTTPTKVAFQP